MATVDIDMAQPIKDIAEPVIVTLSIEEVRYLLSRGYLPQDTITDLETFIEEYDANGY